MDVHEVVQLYSFLAYSWSKRTWRQSRCVLATVDRRIASALGIGIKTFDAAINQNFQRRVTIIWTISDFLRMPICLDGVLKESTHVLVVAMIPILSG